MIVTHGRDIAKRIDPELPRLFEGCRACRTVSEPSRRIALVPPRHITRVLRLDGSRAGNFYLQTAEPAEAIEVLHGGTDYARSGTGPSPADGVGDGMSDVPEFRRAGGHTAYIEGWGLYAESLGTELGLYENSYERYGQLTERSNARAPPGDRYGSASLWLDSGAGHRHHARVQRRMDHDEVVASEVDRYIAMPGQALAYKVGELKIKELRARAEKANSGARFDIRDFHDVVLRNGSIPLTILEREVDRWIATPGQAAQK